MSRADDLRLLGFEPAPTPAQIDAAFRRLALDAHPDRGGDAATFDKLRQARDRLLEAPAVRERCTTCKGSGRVVHSQGFFSAKVACSTCHGSGDA